MVAKLTMLAEAYFPLLANGSVAQIARLNQMPNMGSLPFGSNIGRCTSEPCPRLKVRMNA
jgi:hypothetical protein